MFDKYGEFDSAEELNKAAEELKDKGGIEALKTLAVENGLDVEDAEDYMDNITQELATISMAAVGKLQVESKDLDINGILKDWKDITVEMCMCDDSVFVKNVRKKNKKLSECMALLIKFAFENKVRISDKIVDITMVNHNGKEEKMRKPLYLGVPNRVEVKKIIRDYYMGE